MNQVMLDGDKKLEFGTFLRSAGHFWNSTVLLSAAKDISEATEQKTEIMDRYEKLNVIIKEAHLDKVHTMKALVDGTNLCSAYDIKPGKILKPLMDEMIAF